MKVGGGLNNEGLVFGYDSQGFSFGGEPTTNKTPSPQHNSNFTTQNNWGTYNTNQYNSNTYFSGRDIDIDQFNVSPQITYVNSNGLFASVSGIYYSEFLPNWDVTTVTVGYGKNFGKKKLFKYLFILYLFSLFSP